jgi:serine/threonine protein phosphatase PrpC
LALIYGNRAHIANVGDSRTYVWRRGQLTQITRDHSLAALLAERGQIDKTAIADHPRSNVLYQALGIHEKVDVDLFEWDLQPGDKLLLCSDGLWRAFPDTAELARWLDSTAAPDDLCQRLVAEANRRDGSDNISAVVVLVIAHGSAEEAARARDVLESTEAAEVNFHAEASAYAT